MSCRCRGPTERADRRVDPGPRPAEAGACCDRGARGEAGREILGRSTGAGVPGSRAHVHGESFF